MSFSTFPRERKEQIKEQMWKPLENSNQSYRCPMLLLLQLILNSVDLAKSVYFTKNALTISQRHWDYLNEISRHSILNNPCFGSVHMYTF